MAAWHCVSLARALLGLGIWMGLSGACHAAEDSREDTCGDAALDVKMRRAEYQDSIGQLGHALKATSANPDLALSLKASLAEAYVGARRRDDARALLEVILRDADRLQRPACTARARWLQSWLSAQLGDRSASEDYANKALDALGDRADASVLGARIRRTLGNLYRLQGDVPASVQQYEQAMQIWTAIGDEWGVAGEDVNLAINDLALGRLGQAHDRTQSAIKVLERAGDMAGQAAAAEALAYAELMLGQPYRSEKRWLSALGLREQLQDRSGIVADEFNLASLYLQVGMPNEAKRALDDADAAIDTTADTVYSHALLELKASVLLETASPAESAEAAEACVNAAAASPGMQASCEITWADALLRQQKLTAALQHARMGLLHSEEAHNLAQSIAASRKLSEILAKQSKPGEAIFYGKLAVNRLQELRRGAGTLSAADQRVLLDSRRGAYVQLADLLLSQDRIAEAQQVLRMMKQQELFDYVRGEPTAATLASEISPIVIEADWAAGYRRRAAALLQAAGARVQSELEAERAAFRDFLAQIQSAAGSPRVAPALDNDWSRRLALESKGTVLLQFLTAERELRVVLTTVTEQKSFRIPSSKEQVATTARELLQALSDPSSEPVPLAQAAYQQWLAPLASELNRLGAKTLWLSLDGPLRYVPFAALHDGKGWLAERYSMVVLTEALGLPRLTQKARPFVEIAGLGVSRALEDFPPLPNVPGELASIVRDAGDGRATVGARAVQGVLPGRIYLDEQFNQQALANVFAQGVPLVHIATHFRLLPGTDADSFLLLGDQQHLTVRDFRLSKQRLDGVRLLTLSACETALGGSGSELESMAAVAQLKGAKAVLASLWSVSDVGTAVFMRRYYANLTNATDGAATALRDTQRTFVKEAGQPSASARTKVIAHPFFWAPFVVMGSAR